MRELQIRQALRYDEPMSSDVLDDLSDPSDPSPLSQAVERRTAPRGPIRGLKAQLPGIDEPCTVVEAGLRGLFIATQALEQFDIDDEFEVRLAYEGMSFACTVRVVRKERADRCGYALEVIAITDDARDTFERIRR